MRRFVAQLEKEQKSRKTTQSSSDSKLMDRLVDLKMQNTSCLLRLFLTSIELERVKETSGGEKGGLESQYSTNDTTDNNLDNGISEAVNSSSNNSTGQE